MILFIALIGVASVLAYLWQRQWVGAVLVALATCALAGLAANLFVPVPSSPATIVGDGLRASAWDDLPARPMRWTVPQTDTLRLQFPGEVALGCAFTLTLRRSHPGPAHLQLLAENGEMLADATGNGDLTVQWLPPAAEKLVLHARLLDDAGKVIDQGAVPLVVHDSVLLKVLGRFGAPSFDVRALEAQLAASHAAVDWQVTLGRNITRSSGTRADFAADVAIIDAAWFEHALPQARVTLLARVAAGMPLLILAGNAQDAGIWSRVLQLPLTAQPDGKMTGDALPLAVAPFNPASTATAWRSTDSMLWTRPWQQGRITWIGVADWHRYAITQPAALTAWWQGVLDRTGVRREQGITWLPPEEMALPGQRLAICAQGVKGESDQTLAWQQRADHADASCVAVWPRQPGWLAVGTDHAVYVHDPGDWPLWQKAQRRDATARYLARTPGRISAATSTPYAVPCALLFALALLLLWWRERGQARTDPCDEQR